MKFNIRGENIEVTFAIREYVEKKVNSPTQIQTAPMSSINVETDVMV